jgi:hypothetical protein
MTADTVPGIGTGPRNERDSWIDWADGLPRLRSHAIAAYVVRVTADNLRMDRVRCDGCACYVPPRTGTGRGSCAYEGPSFAAIADWTAWLLVDADHACNAWTPKAGQ